MVEAHGREHAFLMVSRHQRKKGAESQGSLQGLGLNDLTSFSWAPFLKGSTVLDINWGPTLQ